MRADIELGNGAYAEILWLPDSVLPGVILHTIYVPPRLRGQGFGRQLLTEVLTRYGDGPILLAPVPDRDCPIDVTAWYQRHGFTWTPSNWMMERLPTVPAR